jgi:hypothetical protein
MLNTEILEEENGQILYLQTGPTDYVKCVLMWWMDKDTIEVRPESGINLLTIKRSHFNKLFHELPKD